MTALFPGLDVPKLRWGRLLSENDAAEYLGVGRTFLKEHGPAPVKWRGRTLWDRSVLDRFADTLAGQPLDDGEAGSHSRDVERDWLNKRAKRKAQEHG